MAETEEKVNIHGEEVEDEVMEKENESDESERTSMMPDEAYLLELNMVMIIASLTLNNQVVSEFEDMEKLDAKEPEFKTFVSKLGSRKREFNELKIPDKRATRLQPKILDSRHGRKM